MTVSLAPSIRSCCCSVLPDSTVLSEYLRVFAVLMSGPWDSSAGASWDRRTLRLCYCWDHMRNNNFGSCVLCCYIYNCTYDYIVCVCVSYPKCACVHGWQKMPQSDTVYQCSNIASFQVDCAGLLHPGVVCSWRALLESGVPVLLLHLWHFVRVCLFLHFNVIPIPDLLK